MAGREASKRENDDVTYRGDHASASILASGLDSGSLTDETGLRDASAP